MEPYIRAWREKNLTLKNTSSEILMKSFAEVIKCLIRTSSDVQKASLFSSALSNLISAYFQSSFPGISPTAISTGGISTGWQPLQKLCLQVLTGHSWEGVRNKTEFFFLASRCFAIIVWSLSIKIRAIENKKSWKELQFLEQLLPLREKLSLPTCWHEK